MVGMDDATTTEGIVGVHWLTLVMKRQTCSCKAAVADVHLHRPPYTPTNSLVAPELASDNILTLLTSISRKSHSGEDVVCGHLGTNHESM